MLMYMSNAVRISPRFEFLQRTKSVFRSYDLGAPRCFSNSDLKTLSCSITNSIVFPRRINATGERAITNYGEEGPLQGVDSSPVTVGLESISGENHFDRVIAEAQQLEKSVVIVWKAGWCRKCIYLKPKLERLAADYYPRIQFYCVDVNTVPHRLVVRAGITLWKDGGKQAEVIGGHKAHLVINEVREMIENDGIMLMSSDWHFH